MEKSEQKYGPSTGRRLLQLLLFCIFGFLINRLGSMLATALGLPLFLDCLGTVLVASLGGFIPGIVVGYVINVINGLGDGASAYYGVLSVMIAVASVVMAERGWFRKPWGCVGAVLIFTFIGGALGSVLTWFLYGMGFGEGISAPLAHRLFDSGFGSVFISQLTADVLIDLLDKTIIVALAALILHLIPENTARQMKVILWKQTPLSREEQNRARHMGTRKGSLRTRIFVLLAVALSVVVAVTVSICFGLFHNATIDSYAHMAEGVANVAADAVDAGRVDEYLAMGHAAPGYDEAEARLSAIRESSVDIEYIYVYRILEDGCHVVFDPDTEDLPGEEPGAVIPFDESFLPMLPQLLAGEKIEPIVSNDSYGWLLTVYRPLLDEEGKTTAYVGVDIAMEDLVNSESSFGAKALSLFISFALLIIAISIWLADGRLILPLNSMALAAKNFTYGMDHDEELNVEAIRRLNIRTGDEIENLYDAFSKTAEEMMRYVRTVEEKNKTITRMQDSLIAVLADMVESRDKHTGHHIKHTAAYARIIMEQMRKEGIHAGDLTDVFIDNVVRSAPLHDLGKIEIPDAVLNKPGKLTDEEYSHMKYHTLAGKKIIERSAQAVADPGYLLEAGRLAEFHHERWDGKGYPHGKMGEVIPLSARIMAVADVFDALVSKRSYKEGFSIEKSLDIIREGIGTQFDPQVAKAFLDAEPEIRKIAEENNAEENDAEEKAEN